MFFSFLNFFAIFFRNFLSRVENEWNSGLKFYPLFLSPSHPVLTKNNVGKRFFNFFFNFFAIFFRNFLARVKYERNLGVIFFSLFLGQSNLVLAKNNARKRFFNFWIFLLFFFSEFSSSGRVWTEFGTEFFFLYFSAYIIPFWLTKIPERRFWIFLLFFSEFSYPSRV